jgi:hypothetical protein
LPLHAVDQQELWNIQALRHFENRTSNKLLTMFYEFLPEQQLTDFHDATTRRRRGSSQHGAQSSPEGRTNRKGVVFVSDK